MAASRNRSIIVALENTISLVTEAESGQRGYLITGEPEYLEPYRKALAKLIGTRKNKPLPHGQIISKLDKTGASFKVLVLKTDQALPYTSVFFELDCGYWSPEAEARLRKALKAAGK